MILGQPDFDLLMQIGLTKTQAEVYLTLLKLGVAKARTIFKNANVPRPEVYRSLDELQKMGLVEKEITTPYRFKATPLELGLQILMIQRVKQCKEFQERAKKLLRKIQKTKPEQSQENEYALFMVEGRERLMQLIKRQHQNVRRRVDILTTSMRWMQILEFCFEDYEEALMRGVKYQVFVEDPEDQIKYQENVQKLISESNFTLRIGRRPLKTNLAIFDQEEATINFFPSKSLKESPIIVTNHPSFISMCQDHFKTVWNEASNFRLPNAIPWEPSHFF